MNLKIQKSALSKLKHKLSSKSTPDAFFIAHHHSQSFDHVPHTENVLKKRVAFVSLMGLYHSWRECPSPILYSSIFILPLKKEWVYQNKRNKRKRSLHEFSTLLQDSSFVHLLRWKDEQGLVFWMKDPIPLSILYKMYNDNNTDISRHIDPFWIYISHRISSLYDPVTEKRYKPLLLNVEWWNNGYNKQCCTSVDAICKELTHVTMKFKPMRDILQTSNPSMNIITQYNHKQLCDDAPQTSIQTFRSFSDETLCASDAKSDVECTEMHDNVWWMNTEYNDE